MPSIRYCGEGAAQSVSSCYLLGPQFAPCGTVSTPASPGSPQSFACIGFELETSRESNCARHGVLGGLYGTLQKGVKCLNLHVCLRFGLSATSQFPCHHLLHL